MTESRDLFSEFALVDTVDRSNRPTTAESVEPESASHLGNSEENSKEKSEPTKRKGNSCDNRDHQPQKRKYTKGKSKEEQAAILSGKPSKVKVQQKLSAALKRKKALLELNTDRVIDTEKGVLQLKTLDFHFPIALKSYQYIDCTRRHLSPLDCLKQRVTGTTNRSLWKESATVPLELTLDDLKVFYNLDTTNSNIRGYYTYPSILMNLTELSSSEDGQDSVVEIEYIQFNQSSQKSGATIADLIKSNRKDALGDEGNNHGVTTDNVDYTEGNPTILTHEQINNEEVIYDLRADQLLDNEYDGDNDRSDDDHEEEQVDTEREEMSFREDDSLQEIPGIERMSVRENRFPRSIEILCSDQDIDEEPLYITVSSDESDNRSSMDFNKMSNSELRELMVETGLDPGRHRSKMIEDLESYLRSKPTRGDRRLSRTRRKQSKVVLNIPNDVFSKSKEDNDDSATKVIPPSEGEESDHYMESSDRFLARLIYRRISSGLNRLEASDLDFSEEEANEWWEKILTYEPLIIEDFCAYIKSSLRADIDDKLIKKWCDDHSVCYTSRADYQSNRQKRRQVKAAAEPTTNEAPDIADAVYEPIEYKDPAEVEAVEV